MQTIAEAIEHVVSELRGVGLRATTDPARLAVPGALVQPGQYEITRMSGEGQFSLSIYLVSTLKGTDATISELGEMLEKLRQAVEVFSAEPVALPLKNISPDPLPAYVAEITVPLKEE